MQKLPSGKKKILFEPAHDIANKMTCVPSGESDQSGHLPSESDQCLQSGHLPSLIRVFAVHMKKSWLSLERTEKTLISLG